MKPEICSVPDGSKFLPGKSVKYLRQLHKEEQDPKAAERLLAYTMRKEKKSIRQIGKTLNRSYSTIRDWLIRAMQLGVEGRYAIKQDGAPTKIDKTQLEQLQADIRAGPKSCGFETNVWTAPILIKHVEKKFNVTYTDSSIYNILHSMNFSCRKPQLKSAIKDEKNRFKKS